MKTAKALTGVLTLTLALAAQVSAQTFLTNGLQLYQYQSQPPRTCSITVSSSPKNGGKVRGGGTFNAGSSRTVAAAASNGYVFSNWSEYEAVVSSSASYTFTLHYDRNLVANFIPDPFPAVSGAYHGLFYDETNGVSPQTSGCFTITTTPKGACSGSLQVGGGRYFLAGQFDSTGAASNIIARG